MHNLFIKTFPQLSHLRWHKNSAHSATRSLKRAIKCDVCAEVHTDDHIFILLFKCFKYIYFNQGIYWGR